MRINDMISRRTLISLGLRFFALCLAIMPAVAIAAGWDQIGGFRLTAAESSKLDKLKAIMSADLRKHCRDEVLLEFRMDYAEDRLIQWAILHKKRRENLTATDVRFNTAMIVGAAESKYPSEEKGRFRVILDAIPARCADDDVLERIDDLSNDLGPESLGLILASEALKGLRVRLEEDLSAAHSYLSDFRIKDREAIAYGHSCILDVADGILTRRALQRSARIAIAEARRVQAAKANGRWLIRQGAAVIVFLSVGIAISVGLRHRDWFSRWPTPRYSSACFPDNYAVLERCVTRNATATSQRSETPVETYASR
jgi:hypothetical protein